MLRPGLLNADVSSTNQVPKSPADLELKVFWVNSVCSERFRTSRMLHLIRLSVLSLGLKATLMTEITSFTKNSTAFKPEAEAPKTQGRSSEAELTEAKNSITAIKKEKDEAEVSCDSCCPSVPEFLSSVFYQLTENCKLGQDCHPSRRLKVAEDHCHIVNHESEAEQAEHASKIQELEAELARSEMENQELKSEIKSIEVLRF